jgi:FAD/FMN-containing dehydrogenase
VDIARALQAVVDAPGFLVDADIGPRYRGRGGQGSPMAVLRPTTTEQVAAILRLCHDARQPVVAQGGMSGLVDGGTPLGGEVVLSLERMHRIEAIDPQGRTMTAQAGTILQTAQEAAAAQGFLLPLDLGARGSATIGGTIATNAGGVRVIRYGMMRDSVLGLEAVLADGRVMSSLNRMLKNNAGYDLKHLFIGSEGTLGVVTRAVLRLRPAPRSVSTAFVGLAGFAQVTDLLAHLESHLAGTLSSFEAMWRGYDAFVRRLCPSLRPPLGPEHAFTVLVEALGSDAGSDAALFERVLAEAFERGIVAEAVIAKSDRDRAGFWAIREDAGEGFRKLGPSLTYDVSLPIADMDAFAASVESQIAARYPQATTLVLGHLGDGNLHVVAAVGSRDAAAKKTVDDIVYGAIRAVGGSISAEHGIGIEKKGYLGWSRTPVEIAMMHDLKRAFDPHGILNPGKVL